MAKFYDQLNDQLRDFITKQQLFFTATAPALGRINLSPKGIDTFRILDDHTVAYLDLTGSGNETAAHLLENGRLTIMFCSFDREPLILRLYGRGRVVLPEDDDWQTLSPHFKQLPGTRQIMVLRIDSLQTSCGFGVPQYDFKGQREALIRFAESKGEDGMADYRRDNNQLTVDGRMVYPTKG